MRPSLQVPAREELERLYASGLSLYSVGDHFGVSSSTIKKWMIQYGLPRRPRAEATREANLRRPQGNMSRGGGGKSAHAEAVRRVQRKKAEIIRRWKADRGCPCGESHPATLDLHHRDPAEKHPRLKRTKHVGSNGRKTGGYFWRDLSYADLAAELAKCDVLCSNCHRKQEWEQRNDGRATRPEMGEVERLPA